MTYECYSSPDRDFNDVEDASHTDPEHEVEVENVEVPVSRDSGEIGLHFENLFDQNEDGAGELVDVQTGLPFDNSTFTDEKIMNEIGHIDPDTDVERDTQEYTIPELDEADKWLAKHDVSLDTDDFQTEPNPEQTITNYS